MKTKKIDFKKQGANKLIFTFGKYEFTLVVENNKNGKGKVINLYQKTANGLIFAKFIGWVVDDGFGSCLESKSLIRGLTNLEDCKMRVIDYLSSHLS